MTFTGSRHTPTVGSMPGDAKLTEAAVAEFLANHNDFLSRHGDLLEQLHVGMPSEGVTSLMERQVTALRARNRELRERLGELVATARANEKTFAQIRGLTLALMDADDEAALDQALGTNLLAEFQADHTVCFVSDWTPADVRSHLHGVKGVPPLATLFTLDEPRCAAYRPEEYATIFQGASLEAPGSIALVPLPAFAAPATLAIGAADADRFAPDLGTIFLRYLGELLGRTLTRVLGAAPSR